MCLCVVGWHDTIANFGVVYGFRPGGWGGHCSVPAQISLPCASAWQGGSLLLALVSSRFVKCGKKSQTWWFESKAPRVLDILLSI